MLERLRRTAAEQTKALPCAGSPHTQVKESRMRYIVPLAVAALLWCGPAHASDAESAYARAVTDYNIGKYASVLTILKPLAESGHVRAQILLGRCYENGLGVPQDSAAAVGWFRKAAEQGDPMAALLVGYSYQVGNGVPQSTEQALVWIRKAADEGLAEAQYTLGTLYNDGRGVEKNQAEAFTWFTKAAEQGNPYAQRYLGAYYQNGIVVEPNPEQAEIWYGKAAAQGVDRNGNIFVTPAGQ